MTTVLNNFDLSSKKEIFNYYDLNNITSLITHNKIDLKKIDLETIKSSQANPLKKITKIARDPKFDYIANNNFPTVIGTIGKSTN
ncbi:hypothetical protein OAX11_04995 [Flavobacteriaceae bacterium]|nr:hypothetical protein [Flavobacteriaceae bacterium]